MWDKLRYFEMGLGWGSYSLTENNGNVIRNQFANQWVFVELSIRLNWNKLLRIFMNKSSDHRPRAFVYAALLPSLPWMFPLFGVKLQNSSGQCREVPVIVDYFYRGRLFASNDFSQTSSLVLFVNVWKMKVKVSAIEKTMPHISS